jgi:hypothetical protein
VIAVLYGLHLVAAARETAVNCVTSPNGTETCTALSTGGVGIFLVVYLAILVVMIVAYVKIITKAGYSGWWILIALVPLVNVVFFLIFAFSTWPVQKEVHLLRQQAYGGGPRHGAPGGVAPLPIAPTGPWGSRTPGAVDHPPGALPPGGQPGPAAHAGLTENEMGQSVIPSFGQVMRGDVGPGPQPGSTPTTSASTSASTPAATPSGADAPPAGWYPAPGDPGGRQRYWDGAIWTEHYH